MNWPAPDPILEAGEDTPARRAQRANRAANAVNQDYQKTEDQAAAQLLTRLKNLRASLQQRLGAEFLTDFKRNSLDSMLSSVDQMIAAASKGIADDTKTAVDKAASLGDDNGLVPITAAQLKPVAGMPKGDVPLVQAAYGNMVDLLTPPMIQFGQSVKQSIRRVALATDGRQGEINKLRDLIQGQGFDNASYRAERIIRTELGRTFNEATYARLVDLSKQFPFIRKCWRCTRDSRTRIGHVQAAATYGKGNGIPISELFKLTVYDERPGKVPKQIGVATLRFPIDPLVKPEGRIGAAATIMCRCNAFVDFAMSAFADYTKAQVSVALQGVTPPTPPTVPPAPAPPKPLPPIKQPKPAKVKVPRVPKPKVDIGTPVSKVADPTKVGPKGGTAVGSKLRGIPLGKQYDEIRRAMAVLDSVHSDGPLYDIPFKTTSGKNYGEVSSYNNRGIRYLAVGPKGRSAHPLMTTWHETGHWLDSIALGKGGAVHDGMEWLRYVNTRQRKVVEEMVPKLAPPAKPGATRISEWTSGDKRNALMDEWRKAVHGSQAVANIKAVGADRTEPNQIRKHANDYLLSEHEIFARSYAQWIATRSGDPAGLAELKKYQTEDNSMRTHRVANYRQWQDDDFKPIGEALDRIFEKEGWRGKP